MNRFLSLSIIMKIISNKNNLRVSTNQQKVVDLSRGCSIKSFKLKSKKSKICLEPEKHVSKGSDYPLCLKVTKPNQNKASCKDMKLLLLFFICRYATLQTWTAFFYILVMAMVSNSSTLKSLGSLLSGKRHNLWVVFLLLV